MTTRAQVLEAVTVFSQGTHAIPCINPYAGRGSGPFDRPWSVFFSYVCDNTLFSDILRSMSMKNVLVIILIFTLIGNFCFAYNLEELNSMLKEEKQKDTTQLVLSWGSLIVELVGVAGFFSFIGLYSSDRSDDDALLWAGISGVASVVGLIGVLIFSFDYPLIGKKAKRIEHAISLKKGNLTDQKSIDGIADGIIFIGMKREHLLMSWGEPNDINQTVGSWGTHEQFVYGSQYVYVENGVITSWQN